MTPTTQYAENATPIHRYKVVINHFMYFIEVVLNYKKYKNMFN